MLQLLRDVSQLWWAIAETSEFLLNTKLLKKKTVYFFYTVFINLLQCIRKFWMAWPALHALLNFEMKAREHLLKSTTQVTGLKVNTWLCSTRNRCFIFPVQGLLDFWPVELQQARLQHTWRYKQSRVQHRVSLGQRAAWSQLSPHTGMPAASWETPLGHHPSCPGSNFLTQNTGLDTSTAVIHVGQLL